MQAELEVVKANQKIVMESVDHVTKMTYAVLLAVSGLGLGFCLIAKGRFSAGSILYKFTLVCFSERSEDEIVAVLNDQFKSGQTVYHKDFEASVVLIDDTILGK